MRNLLRQKGATAMPFVKILRNGQVTLPKEIRESLDLQQGDILEAEVENNKVVLKPKTMLDKSMEKVFEFIEKNWQKNKNVPLKEIQAAIEEAQEAARKTKR